MIRRQFVLIVVFTLIFQIFFSNTKTIPIDATESNDLDGKITTSTTPTNRCEAASIDEFPQLFFTNEQLRRGGVLVYIALILYSFAVIEIVCDDYFASALERISCNFNLTPVSNAKILHSSIIYSTSVSSLRMLPVQLSWL